MPFTHGTPISFQSGLYRLGEISNDAISVCGMVFTGIGVPFTAVAAFLGWRYWKGMQKVRYPVSITLPIVYSLAEPTRTSPC